MSADCVFCRIVAGTEPCAEVREDKATRAFMDINPVNDGHCLVIPKAHYAHVFDIPPALFGEVAAAAAIVARAVEAELRPDGMSLVQANRPLAGQSVFHLHIHVLPRRADDKLLLNWDRASCPPVGDRGRIADIAARLRARLAADRV